MLGIRTARVLDAPGGEGGDRRRERDQVPGSDYRGGLCVCEAASRKGGPRGQGRAAEESESDAGEGGGGGGSVRG